MRRMDRYNDEETTEKISRSHKNKDLYQNVGTNRRYTNITDVTNANAIDITNTTTEYKTREDYQKMKKYNSDIETPKVKRDLEEFNHIYNKHENRVYDINNVLEEARKNREEDNLEEKRKLKNTSYNILASLNKEEIEKFRQEKKDRLTKDDDELRDLIDTITSKTLAGELEAASDLLSDLMATAILDKKALKEATETTEENDKDDDLEENIIIEKAEIVITTETPEEEIEETGEIEIDDELSLSQKILDKEQIEDLKRYQEQLSEVEEATEEETEPATETIKDEEFYTRSMDLSEEDFDLESEFNKKTPTFMKILIIIILLVAIAVSVYFLKQYL